MHPLRSAGPMRTLRASQNISTNQISAFLAAAESKSFTKAALFLGVTQPTLSRLIGDMERALNARLFERTAHGVSLSATGEAFFLKGSELLAAHGRARHAIPSWRASTQGRIRLAADENTMAVVLPILMRELAEVFGTPKIDFTEASSAEVRRTVLAGEAAFGVCADNHSHPDFRCTLALQSQLGILVSPQAELPEVIDSLSSLSALPMLRFSEESNVTQLLRRHGVEFEAYFSSPLSVSAFNVSLELVHRAEFAVITSGIGASHWAAHDLHFIPLPGLLPVEQVYVISLQARACDPETERLREMLLSSLQHANWNEHVRRAGEAGPAREARFDVQAEHEVLARGEG